jgi:sugar phosphate isomerase/epimerase
MDINRRNALKLTAGMSLGLLSPLWQSVLAQPEKRRFYIGACDWSIHATAQIEAMEVAKKIGLDGVQISLGTFKNNMHLRQKEIQKAYQKAGKTHGVQVGGIAIGELNQYPYKSDPQTERWVSDSITVAKKMGVKVVLLAFFSKGDLKNDLQGQKAVIEKLKKITSKAEKAGVILGIESWLSAKESMEIINAVGSKNVKVYYDVANATQMGYDILKEIRWLGKEQICEFHFKENGLLLGKGNIDFVEVRKAIDDINFEGWVHIEGAVPQGAQMLESYVENNKFVRGILS